jgi:hypothetical protein
MNNIENGAPVVEKPKLANDEIENISANARVATEKEIGTLVSELNYLSQDNKS